MSHRTARAIPDPARALARSPWASLAGAGYGVALICCPRLLIQSRTHERPSRRACAVGRVLGIRQVAQAVVSTACPTRWLIGAGVTADVAHAASMVALAGLDPDLRPALLTDAVIASALAAAGEASLRNGSPAWQRAG
jgi:hypothetical protein